MNTITAIFIIIITAITVSEFPRARDFPPQVEIKVAFSSVAVPVKAGFSILCGEKEQNMATTMRAAVLHYTSHTFWPDRRVLV